MMNRKRKKQEIQKPQERRVITKKNKSFESKSIEITWAKVRINTDFETGARTLKLSLNNTFIVKNSMTFNPNMYCNYKLKWHPHCVHQPLAMGEDQSCTFTNLPSFWRKTSDNWKRAVMLASSTKQKIGDDQRSQPERGTQMETNRKGAAHSRRKRRQKQHRTWRAWFGRSAGFWKAPQ